MIRRHIIMGATLATLALASCGGGDDDPTPTPSPTATPTPTPTASPTYATFPLAGAVEFNTINAATSYTGDPAAGAVTLGVASTESFSSRVRLATSNAIATATYVIRENVEESRFVNANVSVQPSPAVSEFVFRTIDAATAGKFSQLEFLNNSIPSQVTSDASLALTNVSYANWWRGDSTTGAKRITTSVFGYQTALTDMPTTGTQAYASRVVGRLVSVTGAASSVLSVSGTVTTSVNFSTGLVDMTLNLTTIPAAGGAPVTYGTFTAQGAIPVGQNQFTGSFTTGSPLSGTVAGGFFGSQGKEIGITFAASGTIGGANQRLVGVVVGKK
ncbi:transferrin-binding protein-like solute binding protein [Sphingomonas sp. M1-B02]|uniref:transferrin-binding protein-like solute binding protein n=1 Tax=Sphingomonas sp. M1-B02 TaxID=3114300 RepID=UPI00223EC6D6|nr:transferrin-binding protein-like solute binding protein [Sphingomonas sp. S6-11]UZK66047.1 transferrin-binding protein-like solute binding protein [Sphingomonas sp. S6-11]